VNPRSQPAKHWRKQRGRHFCAGTFDQLVVAAQVRKHRIGQSESQQCLAGKAEIQAPPKTDRDPARMNGGPWQRLVLEQLGERRRMEAECIAQSHVDAIASGHARVRSMLGSDHR
jgi:hypothetical protein